MSKIITRKKFFTYIAIETALACAAGCAATKQPSLYDTKPDLLTKQYTSDQMKAVEQGFKSNPLQYSQELGNLILWCMHQKSPQFVLEFAQTPELNDGINAEEARAMLSIYNLIKDLELTPELFEEKHRVDTDIDKLVMEWEGNTKEKENWNGWFYQSNKIRILDAKPINFEPGEDKIDFQIAKGYGYLKWESMAGSGDTDGIIITVDDKLYDAFF
jgi:hypothetical protein